MNEKKTRSMRGQGVVDSIFSLAAPPIALLFWVSIGSVLPYFSSMIQVGSQLSQVTNDNWAMVFFFMNDRDCAKENAGQFSSDMIQYLLRVYETRMELLRAVIVGAGMVLGGKNSKVQHCSISQIVRVLHIWFVLVLSLLARCSFEDYSLQMFKCNGDQN